MAHDEACKRTNKLVRMRSMLNGEGRSSDSFGSGSGAGGLPQGRVQGEELPGLEGRWMEAGEGASAAKGRVWDCLGDAC